MLMFSDAIRLATGIRCAPPEHDGGGGNERGHYSEDNVYELNKNAAKRGPGVSIADVRLCIYGAALPQTPGEDRNVRGAAASMSTRLTSSGVRAGLTVSAGGRKACRLTPPPPLR